ncbi:FAD-binding domain-containing protein [Trichodelitschia bisporula]|uniref:FAD-binding domain-containing protein n=1 Tax=Trichodelitschia bisporula TaxID=703511 RepID=A0A6G1I7K1_9PEZI|nr:FAD-binding domain-containing protein [Trichodelitschia bisporula]
MKLAAILCAGLATALIAVPNAPTPAGCKALPGDATWPAESVWTAALPGAIANPPPFGNATRPDYVFTAYTPADVQSALAFATRYNVRLAIINSGHDFLGRNDAASGLWLAVGNIKGVRVLDSFTPSADGALPANYSADPVETANVIKQAPGKQAYVTFGAGVSTQELVDALDKSGLFPIGAATNNVKIAGGFGQTAGHAPFSSKYGLAADNIVEYKVVTADGKLRVANAVANQDLFWALRGGGGGTFGVVIEATMKVFPSSKITIQRWWLKTTSANDTRSIFEPAAYMHSQFPELNAKGVQGYYYIYPTGILASFMTTGEDAGIEKARVMWAPILAKLEMYPGVGKVIHQYSDFATFKAYFDSTFGKRQVRDPTDPFEPEGAFPRGINRMDSRLLSASHLKSPELGAVLHDAFPFHLRNGMWRGHLVGGGQVFKGGNDTSVHPAWRKAYVHLIGTGVGGYPNITALKRLASDSGCYSNETMWGPNYNRLYAIKKQVDPDHLFWVSPGIGADEFEIKETRLCKSTSRDVLGIAPRVDNNNFARNEADGYRKFPDTQAAADASHPKGSTW